jgi:hypothetical protein
VADLKKEKVVARYLGPADAVAFNLGLLRRSLRSLEAEPMLAELPVRPIDPAFEPAPFPGGRGETVPVPAGWVLEPVEFAACEALPPADSGLAARHPTDYRLVFRALRWSTALDARAIARCGQGQGATGFTRPFQRLGVDVEVHGSFVTGAGETLLLEAEAPAASMPVLLSALEGWVRRVARPVAPGS